MRRSWLLLRIASCRHGATRRNVQRQDVDNFRQRADCQRRTVGRRLVSHDPLVHCGGGELQRNRRCESRRDLQRHLVVHHPERGQPRQLTTGSRWSVVRIYHVLRGCGEPLWGEPCLPHFDRNLQRLRVVGPLESERPKGSLRSMRGIRPVVLCMNFRLGNYGHVYIVEARHDQASEERLEDVEVQWLVDRAAIAAGLGPQVEVGLTCRGGPGGAVTTGLPAPRAARARRGETPGRARSVGRGPSPGGRASAAAPPRRPRCLRGGGGGRCR